ncbi:STAS domain-containing protein [Lentzea sp. NEAU-D13]|uniref:Anti-sigma factor antagonist n=1 Tax=Lentzea alba TaxID=2714351 RepID=A0A7C9RRD2_9PSEU|nr:STAS domain-containing protein [Lentzea alba]NGY60707.1 STAS domain-containing protein [Lentzea alba]
MDVPQPLDLSVDHKGVSTVVSVAGEIDLLTAPRFEAFLRDQLAHTHAVLMIEMSGVNHMGSAGLGALIAIRAECDRCGVDLVFAECSFIVRRVFELSGLTGFFLRGENAAG